MLKFEVGHIVYDTIAKNLLLNVRVYNTYFGCSSCTQEVGKYIEHGMTFPEVNGTLRTNMSFHNKFDEEYHKGESPLEFFL